MVADGQLSATVLYHMQSQCQVCEVRQQTQHNHSSNPLFSYQANVELTISQTLLLR